MVSTCPLIHADAAEFEALKQRMNLTVVLVLEQPPADWTGETGFLSAAIMQKYLPPQYRRFQYFICGPTPMMDAIEKALPKMGVPPHQIHSERFDMV